MQNVALPFRLLIIGLAILVASMGAWVAWVLVSPIDLPFQRVDRSMRMATQVVGQTLHVTGTTDLPDGAVIDWYLWREPIDINDWPSGQAAVQSGAFAFGADLQGWPPGAASADISFSCDWGSVQPKAVTDLVGEHCEHLAGAQVYVDSPGDSKQLVLTVAFTVP